MLPRILEPEVMDSNEEALAYDAMDHSEVNDRFVDDFHAFHGAARGGRYLDLGTGTARIPIALCRKDLSARMVAVDLAPSMLAVARRNVDEAGLGGRITLELADAKTLEAEYGGFEAVLSNSIVHHIPEPESVFATMVRLVSPGGTLFVRDLTRPSSRAELDRLVHKYAGGESDHARVLFSESLHASLTVEEVRAMLAPLGVPSDAVAMTSDRHWTLAWRMAAR